MGEGVTQKFVMDMNMNNFRIRRSITATGRCIFCKKWCFATGAYQGGHLTWTLIFVPQPFILTRGWCLSLKLGAGALVGGDDMQHSLDKRGGTIILENSLWVYTSVLVSHSYAM